MLHGLLDLVGHLWFLSGAQCFFQMVLHILSDAQRLLDMVPHVVHVRRGQSFINIAQQLTCAILCVQQVHSFLRHRLPPNSRLLRY